jgi:hypothetical protein
LVTTTRLGVGFGWILDWATPETADAAKTQRPTKTRLLIVFGWRVAVETFVFEATVGQHV